MERHKIISVLNRKGGVSKTTSSINLASWLSIYGKMKVLYIDGDTQNTIVNCLNIDKSATNGTIYDLLSKEQVKTEDIIYHDENIHFDVIISDENLSNIDLVMANMYEREKQLLYKLENIKNMYDFIIIDCSPSLSLCTINILVATDYILVPLLSDFLSLTATKTLNDDINKIKERLNPNIEVLGYFLSFFDNRRLNDRNIYEALQQQYGDKALKSVIRESVKVKESAMFKKNIFDYDTTHSSNGYIDYYNLCIEIWLKLGGRINEKK